MSRNSYFFYVICGCQVPTIVSVLVELALREPIDLIPLWAAISGAIIATIVLIFVPRRSNSNNTVVPPVESVSSVESVPPVEGEAEMTVVSIKSETALDIMQKGEGLTSIAQGKVYELYLGKTIEVIGPVRNVYYLGDSAIVVMIKVADHQSVTAEFDRTSWGGELEIMKVGQEIAVTGTIVKIRQHEMELSNCSLIQDNSES